MQADTAMLQRVCCWPSGEYWIVAGVAFSTLSSALGSLVGAARVLQVHAISVFRGYQIQLQIVQEVLE